MNIIDVHVYAYVGMGFQGGSDSKAAACNAGDLDLIPGSGRSPEEGNGNPLRILAWRNIYKIINNLPEEPGRFQSMGCKELDTTE